MSAKRLNRVTSNATLVQDGAITSGGVTCQEYSTGRQTWPENFFDCTGGSTPNEVLSNYAQNNLNSTIQGLLGQFEVQLYTLNSLADENNFFGLPDAGVNLPTNSIGYTFSPLGFPPVKGSNNLYSGTFPPSSYNTFQDTETAVHELGHAIDNANVAGSPPTLQSDTSTYATFVLNDWINIDYSVIGATEETSTYRSPCSGANAPLVGVVDANNNNEQFCTNGVLNDPKNQYSNLTNSAILRISENSIFAIDQADGWRELEILPEVVF
jgi:hypothetical protein